MGHGEGLNLRQRVRRACLSSRTAPVKGETALATCDVTSFGDNPRTGGLSLPKETPRADPHAGCCGGRGRETPGYPIRRRAHLEPPIRLFVEFEVVRRRLP